jgi:hypothetical protein
VLVEAAAFRRSRRELERSEIERLARELPLPIVTLPALHVAGLRPADVDVLADRLVAGSPSIDPEPEP